MVVHTSTSSSGSCSISRSGSSSAAPTSSSTLCFSSDENNDVCSGEDNDEYCHGGFHPARENDRIGVHFEVGKKLGWGHFSTVWSCKDLRDGTQVAVKITKSAERYKSVAAREVELLAKLARRAEEEDPGKPPHVVRLLSNFMFNGVNGDHPCLVFECLGPNLLHIIRYYLPKRLPYQLICIFARHLLKGLDFLHRDSIVHCDVKPENIMFRPHIDDCSRPSKRARVESSSASAKRNDAIRNHVETLLASGGKHGQFCLVDFGNSRGTDDRLSKSIQTCQYKSPEVLLVASYDTSVDTWSLACTLFECATGGRFLFNPQVVERRRRRQFGASSRSGNLPDHIPREEEHLAQFVEVLGPIPKHILKKGKRTWEYLKKKNDGLMLRSSGVKLKVVRSRSVKERLKRRGTSETKQVGPLLERMLQLDPANRPSARRLLKDSRLQ